MALENHEFGVFRCWKTVLKCLYEPCLGDVGIAGIEALSVNCVPVTTRTVIELSVLEFIL